MKWLPLVLLACRAAPAPIETGTTPTGTTGGTDEPLVLAAFPGAQGSGATSVGGRGGDVYVVTSLADSGDGTLRACVEASGPRTCVFAVGGTIALDHPLWVEEPYLSVAGQTAPGGGVQITNAPGAVISALVALAAHDVTWRYTRVRNQYRADCSVAGNSECGALMIDDGGAFATVFDHNSATWNQDEAFGVWRGDENPVHDLTFSMNLVAEGLASHSTGLIVGGERSGLAGEVTDVDIHHNLFMSNGHRNPLFKGRSGRLVNNVFYNQYFYVTQVGGAAALDIVANLYLQGPMYDGFHEIQAFSSANADAVTGDPIVYVARNIGWNQADGDGDQAPLTAEVDGENGSEVGPLPAAWFRDHPLVAPVHPIAVLDAGGLADPSGALVATVGASQRLGCDGAWVANRDPVDARLIDELVTRTGITELPATDPGLPPLAEGSPCVDADQDGMADAWEAAHGLASDDPADGNEQRPGANGYTNLELFLSGDFPGDTPLP